MCSYSRGKERDRELGGGPPPAVIGLVTCFKIGLLEQGGAGFRPCVLGWGGDGANWGQVPSSLKSGETGKFKIINIEYVLDDDIVNYYFFSIYLQLDLYTYSY